jgi:hypothetical protein
MCHNTQHGRLPPVTTNINAYFQDPGLSGNFASWQVLNKAANPRNINAAENSNFTAANLLI